jgi:hypothetical protein
VLVGKVIFQAGVSLEPKRKTSTLPSYNRT